ncbi:hypothetical protein BDV12DRAFT_198457 [Aspergillus spectabilis]
MNPSEAEAWTHTTAESYDIEIIRDGYRPRSVYLKTGLSERKFDTPRDAYATGCGWPEVSQIQLKEGKWESAFYLVITHIEEFHGGIYERERVFIVKDKHRNTATASARGAEVHATSTLLAYNDWGGANHYRGLQDAYQDDTPSPLSSTQQPIARGMLRIPQNAPREANGLMKVHEGNTLRFPSLNYSWHFRYSRHYADAGWATYE